ncbi:hypothetical protein Mjas_02520 [Methanothermococcus sp. Ax23]|uniref:hypothetical protein n=1 Tax=Methanothermococcus sp. Ax23 TaxID=3156486 RepID=UPI003B9F9859
MIGINPNKFNNIKIIYFAFYVGVWIFLYNMGAPTLPILILIIPIIAVMGQLRSMLNNANKGSFLYEVKYRSINGKYISIAVLIGICLVFLKYWLIKYGVIPYNGEFIVYFGILMLIMLVIILLGIKYTHLKFYEKGIIYNNTAFYNWDEVELTKDKKVMKLKIKDSSEEILIKNHSFKLDEIVGYYESWNLPKSKICELPNGNNQNV